MSEVHYKTGGPLFPIPPDADAYVERAADARARTCLLRMEYITLIEPRQQGKTSLVYRLKGDYVSQGYAFAYADLTTADRSNEPAWYESVCSWLLRQIPTLTEDHEPETPTNGYTWLRFLTTLAERAEKNGSNLIIVFDEVGATPADWSTDFFSTIRSVYVQRGMLSCLRHLSFVVAGAFNPRLLIRDPNVSNFNVDQRVELPDFTIEQVKQSVARLGLSSRQTSAVANRIYHWTDGQPYLTQCLCRALAEKRVPRTPKGVTQAVKRLRRSDRHHLARILEDLQHQSDSVRKYVERILHGHRPIFVPAEHPTQAQLALIGIVKEGPDGQCVVRNRIYEQALYPEGSTKPWVSINGKESEEVMEIPQELLEEMKKGNVVLLCGAGISVSEGGLPGGGQLAQELAERAELGDVGRMTLPEVAQTYELERGTQSLIAYVAERIGDAAHTPLRTHQLIAQLPFKRVITTNWDTLLEEALRETRNPFVKVVRDVDMGYTDEEKVLLIKLHGSIEQKDTLVITGDDYYDVFARLPQTANLVRSFFAIQTILFLGFGLSDEDFKRLYHEVVRHLGKHKRRAYAVQLNPTPLAEKYWQQKNVQIIAADATEFLEALGEQIGMKKAPPSPPSEKQQASQSTSRPSLIAKGNLSLERGLQALKTVFEQSDDPDTYLTFTTLESRLLSNLRDERIYGTSETVRSERARIVLELNRLAIVYTGRSFNELCEV